MYKIHLLKNKKQTMKKTLLIALLLLSNLSFSKNNENVPLINNFITGYVSDYRTDEKLTGVKLVIIDTKTKEKYSTYSDLDGKYTFNDITRGDYKLIVNYTSYNCDTVNINSDYRKLNILIKSI